MTATTYIPSTARIAEMVREIENAKAQATADKIRAFQTAVHALDMLPTTVELSRCGIRVATSHR